MLILWNLGIFVLPIFLLYWWVQLNKGIKKFQKTKSRKLTKKEIKKKLKKKSKIEKI